MTDSAIRKALNALELVAARHGGKLPTDVLGIVLDAALGLQFALSSKGDSLATGTAGQGANLAAMLQDFERAYVRRRPESVGLKPDMHAPAKPAKGKGNRGKSN